MSRPSGRREESSRPRSPLAVVASGWASHGREPNSGSRPRPLPTATPWPSRCSSSASGSRKSRRMVQPSVRSTGRVMNRSTPGSVNSEPLLLRRFPNMTAVELLRNGPAFGGDFAARTSSLDLFIEGTSNREPILVHPNAGAPGFRRLPVRFPALLRSIRSTISLAPQ